MYVKLDKKCGKSGIPDDAVCTKKTPGGRRRGEIPVRRGRLPQSAPGILIAAIAIPAAGAALTVAQRRSLTKQRQSGAGTKFKPPSGRVRDAKPLGVTVDPDAASRSRNRGSHNLKIAGALGAVGGVLMAQAALQRKQDLRAKLGRAQDSPKVEISKQLGTGEEAAEQPFASKSSPEVMGFPTDGQLMQADFIAYVPKEANIPGAPPGLAKAYHSEVYSTQIDNQDYFVKKVGGLPGENEFSRSYTASAEVVSGGIAGLMGMGGTVPRARKVVINGDNYVVNRMIPSLEKSSTGALFGQYVGATDQEMSRMFMYSALVADEDRTSTNLYKNGSTGKPQYVDMGQTLTNTWPMLQMHAGLAQSAKMPIDSEFVSDARRRLPSMERFIDKTMADMPDVYKEHMKSGLRRRVEAMQEFSNQGMTIGQMVDEFSRRAAESRKRKQQQDLEDVKAGRKMDPRTRFITDGVLEHSDIYKMAFIKAL